MRTYAEFIPPAAKCVVEFGCGDGRTGQEFKAIQPRCRYIGVEDDEKLLAAAAERLDQSELSPFAAMDLPRHGIFRADCLLYHSSFAQDGFADKLKEHAALLADDGQAVFILDNTSYLPNVLALWQGRQPLAQTTLTLPEALAAFEAAGLTIDKVTPLYAADDEKTKRLPETQALLKAFVAYCQAQQTSVKTDIWAKQIVVRAVKREPEPRLLLHTIVGEKRTCARLRVFEPHAFCNTLPFIDTYNEDLVAHLDIGRRYRQKVLIRQRIRFIKPFDEVLQVAKSMQHSGYLVVTEMDDHPLLWLEDYKRTQFLDFAGCHMMQVSTEPLADYMRQYNEHVAVFKNQLRYLPEPYAYDPNKPVTIFFGAIHREKDWQEIMPALNKVLRKYGERVRVRTLFDQKFFAALKTEHKEIVGQEYPYGYVPFEIYEQVLHSSDIALLPLNDNEFNRMKSDLKFIESAGHGTVVLASPTVYEGSVRDGRTGFLYRDAREFRERLEMLIENTERRLETAAAAYAYVKHNRLLAQHYEERIACYREAMARMPELERDLARRLEKAAQQAGAVG